VGKDAKIQRVAPRREKSTSREEDSFGRSDRMKDVWTGSTMSLGRYVVRTEDSGKIILDRVGGGGGADSEGERRPNKEGDSRLKAPGRKDGWGAERGYTARLKSRG